MVSDGGLVMEMNEEDLREGNRYKERIPGAFTLAHGSDTTKQYACHSERFFFEKDPTGERTKSVLEFMLRLDDLEVQAQIFRSRRVHVILEWPALLDEIKPLNLHLMGQVVKAGGPYIGVKLERYEFRTRAHAIEARSASAT